MRHFLRLMFFGGLAVLVSSSARGEYVQTNLVSNLPGVALNQDTNLVNPWGISFGPTTPFWVSDQGTQVATLYNGAGQPYPVGSPRVVNIPPSGTSGPTGQVFNNTTGFIIPTASGGNGLAASFIFANLNGTISAWNAGTEAQLTATTGGAVYTGLALATNTSGSTFLYAANAAGAGGITVFDTNFMPATHFAGKFVDPNAVAGYTPYNIQLLSGYLYVTYAATTSTAPAAGWGWIRRRV